MRKFECVGHEQKRMGNRLLALKKTKLTDGSGRRVQWARGEGGEGGRNRITKNTILLLQKYYGKAIRVQSGQLSTIPYPQMTIHNTSFSPLAKDYGASINLMWPSQSNYHHKSQLWI